MRFLRQKRNRETNQVQGRQQPALFSSFFSGYTKTGQELTENHLLFYLGENAGHA